MNDLHGALVALADRGTPAGSQLLRERVAVDLASDRGRQWAAPPPRGLRIAVAAAIAVIVILGGTLLVSRLTSESTTVVTEPPVVTTVPPPEITLPPPDAGPIPGFTPGAWGRVGTDTMQPVVGLFDMTIVGSRMIAVGFDPDDNFRQDGVIFVSDDGETWTRLAEDDPALTLGFVLMYGVTEGGPGIVAVGMGCENEEEDCSPYATIWTSVDGTSWTRRPSDPEVFGDPAIQSSAALAATTTTDGLIVAVGSMEDWVLTDEGEVESISGRPVVWTSTDGLAWERSWEGNRIEMTLDQFNETSVGMTAVTAGADGLLVGVGESVDGSSLGIAAVWTSPDGVSWERIAHDPAVFAGPDGTPARMFDIAAGDSGFVAVGNADGHPAAWTSPNGRSWQRSTGVDDEFNGSMSSVAALESGFVATGPQPFHDMSEAPVTLWTSPDGTTWDRVQVLDYGYANAMIATPRGIAIAGGLHEDNDVHASVWTGTAFDPTAPPPVPALPEAPTELPPAAEAAFVPADGSGAEYLPDIAGALPGDDGVGPLPLGSVEVLPGEDYLNFLSEYCGTQTECFLDAEFMTPDDSLSGVWTDGRPFHVREGFINNNDEPLGEGFDVVMYITRWSGADTDDGSFEIGQTYRFTSDYAMRGTSDLCGPTYGTQSGPETCEWFVHDFPNGIPEGRYDLWTIWEAPCSAWVDLGFAETCDDPDEVISMFSSGVNSPFGP